MDLVMEQLIIYSITGFFCFFVVFFYLRKGRKETESTISKIKIAKSEGRFEPNSLHPFIDLNTCIGSGACIKACPEKDIIGIVDGKAMVVNATSCIGHGACFHSCPVEAISLRIGTESRGVELPHVNVNYESNIKGIFIAGELGGMGLIKNSVEQGKQAVEFINKSDKIKKDGILDLIIIGAGPAGIAASLAAKKMGMTFEILEQDSLGGTVFTFPRSKIVMTNPMNLPLYGKVKLFDTSKQELLNIWVDALSKNNIKVVENTKVDNIVPLADLSFRIETANKGNYYSNFVLVAIGRRGTPRKLGILGEQNPNVAYRLLEPEQIENKKIIVVGGGDSAVESAMLLMDKNEVIISYRKEKFARLKQKNEEKILKAQLDSKVKIIYNSELVEITESEVIIKIENNLELQKLQNDLVYIFAGGELPTTFLSNAGIEISKKFGQILKKH
jgi:thioredoxin reductase/ferredoxin